MTKGVDTEPISSDAAAAPTGACACASTTSAKPSAAWPPTAKDFATLDDAYYAQLMHACNGITPEEARANAVRFRMYASLGFRTLIPDDLTRADRNIELFCAEWNKHTPPSPSPSPSPSE